MLKNKSYWFILCGLVLVYIFFRMIVPEPVNWNHTYSKQHKYPYGNFATFRLLKDIFPGKEIEVSKEPAYTYLQQKTGGYNYILITDAAYLNDDDSKRLLSYAEKGGNIFIAAEYYGGLLADTLGLFTQPRAYYNVLGNLTDSVTINFSNPTIKSEKEFSFKKYEVQNYFDETYIAGDYHILGEASDSTVNFIRIAFGKGNFYLHSNPLIFTNYNLLHRYNNHLYMSRALSHLPVANTIWDEYYNTGRSETETPLRYVLKEQQLRWAWFTILAFTLLFALFQSKRRQRIIPVIKPLKNTTMEFVKIVGGLYFQQKDHTNLARKKCTYFLENIRRNYYLRTNELDEEFIHLLHIKSGVGADEIRKLTTMIRHIYGSSQVTEKELLELNLMIENFNLKSKN